MSKLIIVLFLSFTLFSCSDKSDTSFLRLDVTSSIEVPVHFANIEIGINTTGADINKVDSSGHSTLVKILTVLNGYGVTSTNTRKSSISPPYQGKDYTFRQTYNVQLRDLSRFDSFRKDLIDAGAQLISVDSYGSDSLQSYTEQLCQKVLNESKLKAMNLAKNGGFKIGGIIKIIEGDERGYYHRDSDSEDFEIPDNFRQVMSGNRSRTILETTIKKEHYKIYSSLLIYYNITL